MVDHKAVSMIAKNDRVRERRAPQGCQPWRGVVLFVAPDGWVGVDLGVRSMSVPLREVELDEQVPPHQEES